MARMGLTTGALWWQAFKEFVRRVLDDSLPNLAASLAYYSVLALFPALAVVVSLLATFGLSKNSLDRLLEAVSQVGSEESVGFVQRVLDSITGAAGAQTLLSLGVIASFWAATAYVGGFGWAVNQVYDDREDRSYLVKLVVRLGLSLALLLFLTASAVIVLLTGPFAQWVGELVGLGHTALLAWSIAKWPVLFIIATLVFALLYRFTPARRQPGLLRLLPGASVGVAMWLAATALFGLYLAHFASYNRTYGILGGAVAFLVWAWILNLALLMGVEVNDVLEHRRARGREAMGRARVRDRTS